MEKLLDLAQVSYVNHANHQNIHFEHHIDGLKQILRIIAILQIEWIIAVMQVILKIPKRMHFLANLARNRCMIAHDFFKRVRWKRCSCLKIQILAETQSAEIVHLYDIFQVGILIRKAHYRARREHDMQLRILEIALAQLCRPVRILERLIEQQGLASGTSKLIYESEERIVREVEVIEIHVKTITALAKALLRILQ